MADVIKAPYGFSWGQSGDDIQNLGFSLDGWEHREQAEMRGGLEFMLRAVTRVPRPVPFAEEYALEFYPDIGLGSVLARSASLYHTFQEKTHKALEQALRKKYGAPAAEESLKLGGKTGEWRGDDGGSIVLSITVERKRRHQTSEHSVIQMRHTSAAVAKRRAEYLAEQAKKDAKKAKKKKSEKK